jgi:membrane-associated phospholipid phosphatase
VTLVHPSRRNLRAWLFGVASCPVLVVLAFELVDRPLASFAHEHFQGIAVFVWLTYLPEPLLPLASLALVGFAIAVALGRAGLIAPVLVRCSVSLVVAKTLNDELKYAFGRTWPETWTNGNPSFIQDGAFGFMPFHGGAGFASFPSGHTTAICAVISVLWLSWPRWCWIYPVPVALVAIGLLGADYHWLSDIIAGCYLGTAVGVTVVSASRPRD